MTTSIRVRLSVMMFLQYATWGLWGVTLADFLGKGLGYDGAKIGWTFNTTQIALILAPLFVGFLTDRLFAVQHVVGVLHLAGAGMMWFAAQQTDPKSMFFAFLGYSLLYFPTLGLTNTLAMRQMSDPASQFPGVRVLGTIGWIAAGFALSGLGINTATAEPLKLAAACSLVLGLYCLTLPHTPPLPSREGQDRSPFAVLAMFKDPTFAVFMLAAFVVSGATCYYYQQSYPFVSSLPLPAEYGEGKTLGSWAAAVQTIGQVSEIFFLLSLPWIVSRIGVKWTIVVGMAAWALRFYLFSRQDFWPILLVALPLHGVSYDFFYVTSYLYVDKKAPPELRASAQGLLFLVTLGFGWLIGNLVVGYAVDANTLPVATKPVADYLLPTFLWSDAAPAAAAKGTMQWGPFWLHAAIGAAVAAVAFVFLFWERPEAKPEAAA